MSKSCPIHGKAIYLDCAECDDRPCQSKKKYGIVVIGLDQSYVNTGISIAADGKLLKVGSLNLESLKTNSEKRSRLRKTLGNIIGSCKMKADKVVCVFERIRLQSKGFINMDYIKSMGALNSVIIDVCSLYSVGAYSVDTRCWKSQVIGTSKPKDNNFGVPPEKWPTIEWFINCGYEQDILIDVTKSRKTKGTFERDGKKYMYNNDAADSAGIALFWFVGDRNKLQIER